MVTSSKALAPIVRLETDKENGLLSKDEFKAKMRKKRELDARMKAYEQTAREEIERELEEPVKKVAEPVEIKPEPEVEEPVEKPKRGRKPKV